MGGTAYRNLTWFMYWYSLCSIRAIAAAARVPVFGVEGSRETCAAAGERRSPSPIAHALTPPPFFHFIFCPGNLMECENQNQQRGN